MLTIKPIVDPSKPAINTTIQTTIPLRIVATKALQQIDQPMPKDFFVKITFMISPIFHPLLKGSIARGLLVGKENFNKGDFDPASVALAKRAELKGYINFIPIKVFVDI